MRSDHIALLVGDLELSKQFYMALGGVVTSKKSPHFLELVVGDLRMHLIQTTEEKTQALGPRMHHFCLRVDSEQTLVVLKQQIGSLLPEQTLEIIQSPPMGDDFLESVEQQQPACVMYARDPDGITIEFRLYPSLERPNRQSV